MLAFIHWPWNEACRELGPRDIIKMTASRPGYNLLPWRQVITSHMPMTSMEPQWVSPASWGSLFTFSQPHTPQAHSWYFCLQRKTITPLPLLTCYWGTPQASIFVCCLPLLPLISRNWNILLLYVFASTRKSRYLCTSLEDKTTSKEEQWGYTMPDAHGPHLCTLLLITYCLPKGHEQNSR